MTAAVLTAVDEVTSLVDGMTTAAQSLIAAPFWKLTGDELLDLGRSLETLTRTVWAAQVHVVDELDQTGAAPTRSVSSTAALIRDAFRISPAEAGIRVAAARAMLPRDLPSGGEIAPACPALAAAVDAGRLDDDHVRTVLSTLRRLPDVLAPDVVAQAETTLVEHAMQHDATQFRTIARHLETVLNPDGAPPDNSAAHTKVEFGVGQRSIATGLTRISGWLDDLGIATLSAVINPLAAPKPEMDGLKDLRPAATRRAHALIEALSFVATNGDSILPDSRGERPHVTVTLDWDQIREQARNATIDGHLLSAGDARRLLCDAQIIPAVLNGRSEVLDVGHSRLSQRGATTVGPKPLSVAASPCRREMASTRRWTRRANHVNWWQRDLGTTSYRNGVLLCAFHHSEAHRSEWQIRFAADGIPELIPPKWLDPKQQPRRNTLHHVNPIRRT